MPPLAIQEATPVTAWRLATKDEKMKFLVPQGIGDSIWCLLKIQDANRKLGGGPIDVRLACMDNTEVLEQRAMQFISKFGFVNSVGMYQMPRFNQGGAALVAGPASDERGYYRYLPDGTGLCPVLYDIDFTMMPNAALERGIRLEEWLPEYEVNWNAMEEFSFSGEDAECSQALGVPGSYVVFYLGSETANSTAGHNRNAIWTPQDWVRLGSQLASRYGLSVVVVGADYDHSYYANKILPLLSDQWVDMIGKQSIGSTLKLCQQSSFVISYQSGIGIVSSYMKKPVGIFWRARGDSISDKGYVTFDESMSSAWASPESIALGKHLPLIYGKHGVEYILDEIEVRKWAT